ncbi:MAG: hypothetical protein ACRD8U_20775, partial [Pyrinomonadaceae bacterium]
IITAQLSIADQKTIKKGLTTQNPSGYSLPRLENDFQFQRRQETEAPGVSAPRALGTTKSVNLRQITRAVCTPHRNTPA